MRFPWLARFEVALALICSRIRQNSVLASRTETPRIVANSATGFEKAQLQNSRVGLVWVWRRLETEPRP